MGLKKNKFNHLSKSISKQLSIVRTLKSYFVGISKKYRKLKKIISIILNYCRGQWLIQTEPQY